MANLFISTEIGVQNSIDPVFVSAEGHNYLFWGSFRGICAIELTDDGTSVLQGAEPVQIAGTAYEGTYILKHGRYWYMFASTGTCCEGLNSTYQTVVGRAENIECMYTRTTGVRQTVWMEAVARGGLERVRTTTDIDRSEVSFQLYYRRNVNHACVNVKVYDNGKLIATQNGKASSGSIFTIPIKKSKLWSPESPFLNDVVFEVLDNEGKIVDKVDSYFGMRKRHIEGNKIYLNNPLFYMRLVLDQGMYPDGIRTVPSDEALKHDIEMSMAVGFNWTKLHQKVFEDRFYYRPAKVIEGIKVNSAPTPREKRRSLSVIIKC